MRFHRIKMRYSIEPTDRIYVRGFSSFGYGFSSFAKNLHRNFSNKYSQKLLDSSKKLATDTIKTASKRASQKTTEATGDLIGNKIAGKITSVSKKSRKELQNDEMEAPKKDIYLKKKEKMN